MKILFGVASAAMLLLGVSWLAFPQGALSSWGLRPDEGLVFIARRYGAMCLGYAVILWLSRGVERSPARTGLLLGNAIANGAMALLTVTAVTSGAVTAAAWSAAVVEGLLAVAFLYYCVSARRGR